MEKVDNKTHERQVELMKKRFDVDEEKKIVKLDLHYESVDEILETNIDAYVPTFDRSKFERIKEVITDFPTEYKVDINMKIDDYKGLKPEDVMDGFNDAVELTHYDGGRQHKKKWIQIVFLLIAGILILSLIGRDIIFNILNLNESGSSVLREVLDITSWVFVWQAVSLMFLSPTESRLISLTLVKRLNQLSFLDKNGKVVASEHYLDSYSGTAKERKARKLGKYLLLITGAAFFGLGTYNMIEFFFLIPSAVSIGADSEMPAISIIISLFFLSIYMSVVIIEILGGLSAISAFTGKLGKMYRFVFSFGIISLLLEIATIVVAVYNNDGSIVPAVVGSIVSLGYMVGAILIMLTREKPAKKKS